MFSESPPNPEASLSRFGLTTFRPGQREVIDAVLHGEDCLCIMPTGGGKSLCYQLPSIMRPGVTLVVSPLIALMKDQVDALTRRNMRADYINSALTVPEQATRLAQLCAGELDLLYVAPERFRSPRFLEAVRHVPIQLLAVDEAHCISEWGHDFRHDYTRLGLFRQRLGNPQTIALTATATHDVRADVIQQLQLQQPRTFVAGFARPNLHYEAQTCQGARDKQTALTQFISDNDGCGIVYAATRKACHQVAEDLNACDSRTVAVYHAGMLMEDRRSVQEQFMSGNVQIVVATNAFGMGIDKANVRFVAHFHLPGSLEAYYQEAGRSGRDGLPARCLLLYSAADRYIQEFFIDNAFPSRDTIRKVYEFLRQSPEDLLELTQEEVKDALGLSLGNEGIGTCERLLEKAGVLERLEPNQNMAAVRFESELPTLIDLLPRNAASQRSVLRRLEQLAGDRRDELVYFHPQSLARQLEMQVPSVHRALRELNRLSALTYVPPFRGRALRIRRRDLAFQDLPIDFEGLEQRRQSNREKLQRVVDYAASRRCRQELLLDYFGDPSGDACGHCDNCDQVPAVATRRTPTSSDPTALEQDALRLTVTQALSGVARANGRFGKQMIVAMLCGSQAAKVRKWKLDQLSTFGLLRDLRQTDVGELLDALVDAKLVEQSDVDRFRPVARMTPLGWDVVRGTQTVDTLFLTESLRAKIEARAATAFPAQAVGPPPAPDCPRPAVTAVAPEPGSVTANESGSVAGWDSPTGDSEPDFYWTWKLFHDGYTLPQCAAIRRTEPDRLLEQLLEAAQLGRRLPCESVLGPELIAQLDRLTQQLDSRDLSQLLSHRPSSVSEQQVRYYWACCGTEIVRSE